MNPPTPTGQYVVTPALPIQTTESGTFTITKNDGTNFTTEEVEGLKFTIDGNVVSATLGSSIDWKIGNVTVLYVARTTWGTSIEVSMLHAGNTISAVE